MSVQAMIQSVRQSAISKGGNVVPYSQMLEPTNTLIKTLKWTESGICRALACKWIVEHANGGSLWNWLFVKGTTNVEMAKIANLMINFSEGVKTTLNPTIDATQVTATYIFQDVAMDAYLKFYANLIRRQILPKSLTDYSAGGSTGATVASAISGKMAPRKLLSTAGTYIHIYIGGTMNGNGAGHSMAAFVAEDVAFFDPNFGEFYFSNYNAFRTFFADFWTKSGYAQWVSSHQLDCFARKVN